jgi:hypothetical protein
MPTKPLKVGDHIRVSMHGGKIVDAVIKENAPDSPLRSENSPRKSWLEK